MAKKKYRRGFDWLDRWLYRFLLHHVEDMPLRFCKMIAYFYTDARIRKLYLERIGVSLGEHTYTNLGLLLITDSALSGRAKIGNHVSIGPNLTLICDASANNGDKINQLPYVKEKITTCDDIIIEDEVWIGANVTILPGIHIGTCSMIGAGSVVIRDVEPYSLYAGVPAKRIRDLRTGERVDHVAQETLVNFDARKLCLFVHLISVPCSKFFWIYCLKISTVTFCFFLFFTKIVLE